MNMTATWENPRTQTIAKLALCGVAILWVGYAIFTEPDLMVCHGALNIDAELPSIEPPRLRGTP